MYLFNKYINVTVRYAVTEMHVEYAAVLCGKVPEGDKCRVLPQGAYYNVHQACQCNGRIVTRTAG
jgi:hypothetical protein